MSKPVVLFILSLLISILSSCSKERSKKWLVANIQVIDADTQNGVKSRIRLKYFQSSTSLGTGPANFIELGNTDENGNLYIEHEIGRSYSGMKLEIFPLTGFYYAFNFNNDPLTSINVYATSANNETISISPIYPYSISIKNTSCSGATDSVWINHTTGTSSAGSFELTGCVDTTYGPEFPYFTNSSTEVIQWVSKKNGILDSGTIYQTYTHGEITPVNLEY